ncbi:MICOS complex subunit MIC19-like [Dysidea avara]|uniref:MICOS complex subunit MIC19-like n=1 Tax=Dysidea avara TaxID=196820 RepID=UPI003334724D
MGAGGSSEEREVTVEQDDSDSSGLSIKVTEDFVKHVYNKSSGRDDDVEDGSTSSNNRDLKRELAWYKQELQKEQRKIEHFQQMSAQHFSQEAEVVHQKFESTPLTKLVPVCKDLEQQVLQCYKQNPGRSLNCSDVVRNYQECVNKARKGVLAK